MRVISKALELTDVSEINKEINERRVLLEVLHGTLYPRIVQDEIFQLQRVKEKLTYAPIQNPAK